MTFLSEQHRLSFNTALDRIGKYDRKNCALVAALYLLTADFRLWNQTQRYVENHGISFGKLRPKNCSEYSYSLYCAAKDLYLGTKHITINDLHFLVGNVVVCVFHALWQHTAIIILYHVNAPFRFYEFIKSCLCFSKN